MIKLLVSFLLFACCLILPLPSHAAAVPDTSVIQEGIRSAECVRPYNGGVLIANYGTEHVPPGIDDREGYILFRKNGQTSVLIPPGILHNPSGMAVKDHYLFVCDGKNLRVYNLDRPETVLQTITFPAPYYLKSAAVDGNTLYVSSDNVGQIFALDITHPENMNRVKPVKWLELQGARCMAVSEKGVMYITALPESGPDIAEADMENVVYRVSDLRHPKAEKFISRKIYSGDPAADKNTSIYYDGITLSEDQYALYVSDFRVKTGAILAVDIGTKEVTKIYEAEGLAPADLTQTYKALYIPDMKNHRVIKLEL
ncbi:MAG: PQQ-binding-like beta-propeller repeat protein [Acidaminococcaceae bacterium]|nr:PQQ-binding-like beta-propeller repeat protein [Acidaminococcaceae bacterium]